jgi:hypothetical protein
VKSLDPPEHLVRGQNRPDQPSGINSSAESTQWPALHVAACVPAGAPNLQSALVVQLHVLVIALHPFAQDEHRGASAQLFGTTSAAVDGANSASQTCWTHRFTKVMLCVCAAEEPARASVRIAHGIANRSQNCRAMIFKQLSPLYCR